MSTERLRGELLARKTFSALAEARSAIKRWRRQNNTGRIREVRTL